MNNDLMRRLVIVTCIVLSGCSWFSGDDAIKELPDTPVELVLTADKIINPSAENKTNPVVINIYQLKQKNPFIDSDALSLFQKDAELLAGTLIDKRVLEPLLPGEKRNLTLMIQPKARVIGVFAEFENYTESKGVALIVLDKEEKIDHLEVSINMLSANINKVVDDSLWGKVKRGLSWF